MHDKEYIIFCDESDKRGKFYSNFYGGVIVGSSHYQSVTARLQAMKDSLNLGKEIKWQRVSENYLDKYMEMIQAFFHEIRAGTIRVRILFTQNAHVPLNLSCDQIDQEYFLLYYQFIKHAFGLRHLPVKTRTTRLRLYFDEFPETGEKVERFKGFLLGLAQDKYFRQTGIRIAKDDVTEVRSHEHIILQCLDVVLGAMTFRLNDKYKEKPPGQRIRGKRTRAKEKLYKAIFQEIRSIHPGFNIGISTGLSNYPHPPSWTAPYLHWCFRANDHTFDETLTKGHLRNAKDPAFPT